MIFDPRTMYLLLFKWPVYIVTRWKTCINLKTSPPHFCSCPKPEPGFPTPYVVVFVVFNGLRWEVVSIVCFVDTGGIVDHHRLNILFITILVNFLVQNIQPKSKIFQKLQLNSGFIVPKHFLDYLAFHTWWKLIQRRVARTKFDIYVFIIQDFRL